jgi:prepilin-type N-terminal cleavage/methylation domain-containing protein
MRSSKCGFTLVEVMVALVLLGLIATLVASGTRLTLDLSARGNSRADAIRRKQIVRDVVRRQLQGALPFRYWTRSENTRTERIAFEGAADGVRFVSRNGISDGPNALPRWVELRRQNDGGQSVLVVEEHRIIPPDNQPDPIATTTAEIAKCAESGFEYLEVSTDSVRWVSAWSFSQSFSQGKPPLPAAVRIRCDSAGGERSTLLVTLDYGESALRGLRAP